MRSIAQVRCGGGNGAHLRDGLHQPVGLEELVRADPGLEEDPQGLDAGRAGVARADAGEAEGLAVEEQLLRLPRDALQYHCGR